MISIKDNFFSKNQAHDLCNQISSTVDNNFNKECDTLTMSLEEIKIKENHNMFIDSEEYISLILDNQLDKVSKKNNDITNKELSLKKKYFNQWKDAVICEDKTSRGMANDRISSKDRMKMIDDFFDNITKHKKDLKEKKKLSKVKIPRTALDETSNSNFDSKQNTEITHSETFYHRFHAQKNIIALQKLKLQQQERIIEDLKLKKYVEDAGDSNNLVADVRRSLLHCERSLKPKLKCIAGEDEDAGDLIIPYCTKIPKIIQKMEQRARQREEKRAIVRERRRQMELEKQRAREQMELEKQILDQEEKNKRLNEYKERRKQEQLIAIRRKEIREKMRALRVMADLHYENKIIIKYGISAFKKYLIRVREDHEMAVEHCTKKLIKNHFISWKNYTLNVIAKRTELADNLHNTKLTKWAFQELKKEHRIMVKKRQVAEDWFDLRVTEKIFVLWRLNIRKLRYHRRKQWNLAVHHYETQLLWKVIGCWQTLPTINKLEREHEARKQKWRRKVQQVLPDFIPRSIDETDEAKYI